MIQALKRFGQNFLQDEHYLQMIANAVDVRPGQKLLEIGPGLGALTQKLVERGLTFSAVEIDIRLVRKLQEKFKGKEAQLQVEHGDILRTDLLERAGGPGGLVLVGNIPYNITHLLMLHMLKSQNAVARATMMVQKEVADRLCSPPDTKSYSFIAASVQTFFHPRILFAVPPEAFQPIPKVDSCVVALEAHATYSGLIDNNNKYIRMVSNAFAHRRKKVINVLAGCYPRETIYSFFSQQGLSENLRAENIPVETYVALFRHLRGVGENS